MDICNLWPARAWRIRRVVEPGICGDGIQGSLTSPYHRLALYYCCDTQLHCAWWGARHLSRIPFHLANKNLLVRIALGIGRDAVRLYFRGHTFCLHDRLERGSVGALSHRARLAQASGPETHAAMNTLSTPLRAIARTHLRSPVLRNRAAWRGCHAV